MNVQTSNEEASSVETGSPKAPPTPPPPPPPANVPDPEDEEVRIAMELAIAAAQNPHMTPAELRQLMAANNAVQAKQLEIVSAVEEHLRKKMALTEKHQQRAAEMAWEEKKQRTYTWWTSRAASVVQTAADLKFEAEKQYYAEEIKQDKTVIATRKQMKLARKTLKAHRLTGNRIETRNTFKRQRMEKKLLAVTEKIRKQRKLLTHSSFNVQEYAKAMVKASKKWRKKCSKQELSLEAQLCRNMHQMLALEKQKAATKKGTREVKKYLQRCKSWLSDKKAFGELHVMTLEATASSMAFLYQDTLEKQDALIARLLSSSSDEFAQADLETAPVPPNIKALLETQAGPRGMLNALRGLPIQDSVRLLTPPPPPRPSKEQQQQEGGGLIIEAHDDCSVSSNLTDPDSGEPQEINGTAAAAEDDDDDDDDSAAGFDFGEDAPWMKPGAVTDTESGSDELVKGRRRSGRRRPTSIDGILGSSQGSGGFAMMVDPVPSPRSDKQQERQQQVVKEEATADTDLVTEQSASPEDKPETVQAAQESESAAAEATEKAAEPASEEADQAMEEASESSKEQQQEEEEAEQDAAKVQQPAVEESASSETEKDAQVNVEEQQENADDEAEEDQAESSQDKEVQGEEPES